jgi:FkbM family methyltransferase
MLQKIRTLLRYIFDPKVSKRFIVRYALGQALAYSGLGRYLTFATPYYKLHITKSPVAMVLFGDPHQIRDEEAVLQRLLRKGDVVVDIGANIGTFSLRAASLVGHGGVVYACEAHPQTAELLRRNTKLNDTQGIIVLAHALGDHAGEVSFTTASYDDINHVAVDGAVRVPVVRLDDVDALAVVPRIRCVKIDVEGYELSVLRGGEQVLARTDYVIFEAYEPNCLRFGYTVDTLYDWFESRGFTLYTLDQGAPISRDTTGRSSVENVLAVSKSM